MELYNNIISETTARYFRTGLILSQFGGITFKTISSSRNISSVHFVANNSKLPPVAKLSRLPTLDVTTKEKALESNLSSLPMIIHFQLDFDVRALLHTVNVEMIRVANLDKPSVAFKKPLGLNDEKFGFNLIGDTVTVEILQANDMVDLQTQISKFGERYEKMPLGAILVKSMGLVVMGKSCAEVVSLSEILHLYIAASIL